MDGSQRWVTLAFTWNGLRALGVPEDALATFPDEFREGMAARADILGDTGDRAPEHWVGGLAGDDLHAIAILFARDDEEYRRCIGEHDKLLARCDGRAQSVVPRPERQPAVQLRPRPFRLPGPAFPAGDEGLRSRNPHRARVLRWNRASSSSATPTRTDPSRIFRSPKSFRATVATWPTGGCRSTSGAFREYLARQRRHPRRAGAAGGEVHGPLAQRRAAGAGARRRRPRARRGSDAQQRLQLQGDGSARLRLPAGIRMPGGSIRATPPTT